MPETLNPKAQAAAAACKLDLTLIPDSALAYVAHAFMDGARPGKYAPYDYRSHPVSASVYVAAARRHIAKWFDGEAMDAESGVHHLGHAIASLMILIDAELIGNLVPDRPGSVQLSQLYATIERWHALSLKLDNKDPSQ